MTLTWKYSVLKEFSVQSNQVHNWKNISQEGAEGKKKGTEESLKRELEQGRTDCLSCLWEVCWNKPLVWNSQLRESSVLGLLCCCFSRKLQLYIFIFTLKYCCVKALEQQTYCVLEFPCQNTTLTGSISRKDKTRGTGGGERLIWRETDWGKQRPSRQRKKTCHDSDGWMREGGSGEDKEVCSNGQSRAIQSARAGGDSGNHYGRGGTCRSWPAK